ncbi:FG-GAP-like repeat-containing protein [Nocardioides speluncae]|uniref:FG-GAP-like repeat-containing protein n=1 Tax=Nocardioides speluncae TaxID=2670337 RepID=UPI000D69224D|nr:FG-GAP-like repeat-containing protein [Nocardioides speluncae]
MPPSKARFVTACQQLLALGAVLAVLAPAADVISLDVVPRPSVDATHATNVALAGDRTEVATAPVEPTVSEYPLGADPAKGIAAKQAAIDEVTSRPAPVAGYGAVGVTWSPEAKHADGEVTVEVRTRKDGAWSDWSTLPYHAEHAPDPDSPEAAHARPGTDPVVVGDVDDVQVRATASGGVPADLKLAVIDPGASDQQVEAPAIDTDTLADPPAQETEQQTDSDQIKLQAGTYTPRPKIYSRAQWGANESLRDPSSLHYYEVHAGFVHHTVNANDYTAAEVPSIIRGIYAYHVQSRGWSDIGYNFLVDRFGRVWEGRYGGVDRPVVGAHTLDYNDYSFAMSAIGNFETAQPSKAMLDAYGRVFAWKLSLHGVTASSTRQQVGSSYFPAINGHRDAAQTACPGKYLYAKIPYIRLAARGQQRSWSGRERDADLVGSGYPDLLLRRKSDKQAVILPTGGLLKFVPPQTISTGYGASDIVIASPDLTGDRRTDVLARNRRTGMTYLYPGNRDGKVDAYSRATVAFRGLAHLIPVGDLTGDRRNDLIGRDKALRLYLFKGKGNGAFTKQLIVGRWGYNLTAGAGDVTGDGRHDLVARDRTGKLWVHPGTGAGRLGRRIAVAGNWSGSDVITGFGDYSRDGRPDLFVRNASSGRGYVFPGRGNGRFGHWLGPIGGVKGLASITGGNLVGTAAPDLVARSGDRLVVLRHPGTYETGRSVVTGTSLWNARQVLNVGDWNRDGHGDLMVRTTSGSLVLRLGRGGGQFGAPDTISNGFGSVDLLTAVGDTTGDGYPDLMGQPSGRAMRIYPGTGTGLRASYVAHRAIDANQHVGVGRWDGDGAPDNLLRANGKLVLYPGNGPGGLTKPKALSGLDLAPYDWVIGVGAIDNTGRPDLLVREKATGYLFLIQGHATGFAPRRFLAEGLNAFDLVG